MRRFETQKRPAKLLTVFSLFALTGFAPLSLTSTPVSWAAQPNSSPKVWYAAARAHGDASGTSRANAVFWRTIDNLPLGPGDSVNFLTDEPYPVFSDGVGLVLTKRGTPAAPITFRGVGANDSTPACATLTSNRSAPYVPPAPDGNGRTGRHVFWLAPGANNLHFQHLCARNVEVMFYVATRMENMDATGKPIINRVTIGANDRAVIKTRRPHPLSITNVELVNGRRLLDVQAGTGVVNGWFSDLRAEGFSKTAMRFIASSNNVIQNVFFDGQDQTNDHFQVGIHFKGNTAAESNRDNLIRNAVIKNTFEDLGPSNYAQGDSVSDEEFDSGTRIESSQFSDAGDAGFDAKGKGDVVVDTTVTRAKRSYRHHCCSATTPAGRSLTLIRVTSIDPMKRAGIASTDHLQATGTITARNSTFTGLNPSLVAFKTERSGDGQGGATITLADSQLTLAQAAIVSESESGTQVILGNLVVTRR